MSDKCMTELIGSHKSYGASCDISSECVVLMTSPGLVGYGITHQLLWTMLAQKVQPHSNYLTISVSTDSLKCCPMPDKNV